MVLGDDPRNALDSAAEYVRWDDFGHHWPAAAVRRLGWRAPCRVGPSSLPCRGPLGRELCLPNPPLPRRRARRPGATPSQFCDPDADRCARATGLRPCRHDYNACVLLSTIHARPAALPVADWRGDTAACAGATGPLADRHPAVQRPHRLHNRPERPRITVAAIRARGQPILLARLGLGAGNFIISPDSEVAKLLQTWAAHNEYLRMEVEGGSSGVACWWWPLSCGWSAVRNICLGLNAI